MDTIASLFPGPPAPAATQPTIGIYEGRFSRAPSTHTDGAYFYLDSFDEGVNEFGPCPWTVRTLETTETGDTTADVIARHLLPAVGDRCWVTFTGDADGVGDNPVILMWWPLGRGFQDTRV